MSEEAEKCNTITVTFDILESPPKSLFLRETIASGICNETSEGFEVSRNITGGALIFRLGNGSWYSLGIGEFVKKLLLVVVQADKEAENIEKQTANGRQQIAERSKR